MISNQNVCKIFCSSDKRKINRRTFITNGIGCTAGLALLAHPGKITEVLAAQQKSKEEILKELEAKAEKYLPMYMSCAISSFAALNEQFKLGADEAIPALMPFTGGIVMKGETCGAVSGSMLAFGYRFESGSKDEQNQAGSSIKFGGMFADRFEKEFSSIRCSEVVKNQYGRYYNFLDPEEQKLFMAESQKSGKCLEVVKKAVTIAGDIILSNS
jgi:C_GCAxxG_C_C family probable redox protein